MKLITCLLISGALMAQESTGHKLGRRILSATSCGLSAADGWQSTHAAPGVREANPVGLTTVLAVKPLACGSVWYVGEATSHKRLALWEAIGMTVVYGLTVAHNSRQK